jgi:hypothetical protein
MYFDYKRGEIHLITWFARGQRFETYFCEVHVRNGKTAKRNVWSPKFAIFSICQYVITTFTILRYVIKFVYSEIRHYNLMFA